MMAFVGFAMFGFFTSLAPALIAGTLRITSHVAAGSVAFSVFAAAAIFQMTTSRWARATQIPVGLVILALGLALVTASIVLSSMPLLVAGGIVAGAGVGVTFKAAIGTVISIAPAETRGEALAGLFLVGYVGMAVPVLLLGLLLQSVALAPAVMMFGGMMLVLLATTATMLAKTRKDVYA